MYVCTASRVSIRTYVCTASRVSICTYVCTASVGLLYKNNCANCDIDKNNHCLGMKVF